MTFSSGSGGLPSDPEQLYCVSFKDPVSVDIIIRNPISSPEDILRRLPKPEAKPNQTLTHRTTPANAYKPWSKADDKMLAELYSTGSTVEELMVTFGRSRRGILSRLRKLGLRQ